MFFVITKKETIQPSKIRRVDKINIEIQWIDGLLTTLSGETLRRHCPCATCQHVRTITSKTSSLQVVTQTLAEQTELEKLWAIGNYAIGIRFMDGHQTGIFTYSILRTLSEAT